MCGMEELLNIVSAPHCEAMARVVKDVARVTTNFIQDDHTRNMVIKIVDGLKY